MTQIDFDKSLLVLAAWRLASSNDVNESTAIMCVLRNAVVRRGFKSYGDAVEHYTSTHPLRKHPRGNEPQLIDPETGLLSQVDGIYNCSVPDITSSTSSPFGASEFCNARIDPGFATGKKLIGNFGSMSFYE